MSRYSVGIDLGTTNSVLAYVDLLATETDATSQVLELEQVALEGRIVSSSTLPSVVFVPPVTEDAPVVGWQAREQEALTPDRVIRSAKSWLCFAGVDRHSALLPWDSEDVDHQSKLSPVAASALILQTFAAAWNSQFAKFERSYELAEQSITITVPASFDETAQRLTLEAAKLAGLGDQVRLLEEPQAVFYRWLEANQRTSSLRSLLGSRKEITVLVCDVGGGTTDMSLFKIERSALLADPKIERVAVSEHILLGGDNIDLTIAHLLEQRFTEGERQLRHSQWNMLVSRSRELKERFLGEANSSGVAEDNQELRVSLPGLGSGLFASAMTVSLNSSELSDVILEGFFPICDRNELPERHLGGLHELGLPFEPDTRISVHLANFLQGRTVDAVLWNGGTLTPLKLRERLLSLLQSWQSSPVVELENVELDQSVARGAAAYGAKRLSRQELIRAAAARSIYVELEKGEGEVRQLLCVLPYGAEPEQLLVVEGRRFGVSFNRAFRLRVYSSVVRSEDRLGDIVSWDSRQFHSAPSIEAELRVDLARYSGLSFAQVEKLSGEIELSVCLTELGLLKFVCQALNSEVSGAKWELVCNLREAAAVYGAEPELGESRAQSAGLAVDSFVSHSLVSHSADQIESALGRIGHYFGRTKAEQSGKGVKGLWLELEQCLAVKREQWQLPLLRALWPGLREGMTRRGRSLQHELVWLSMAGYLLRPGVGSDLDRFRMNELWRCFELGMNAPKEPSVQVQWWIMWRRVAAGLDAKRQRALAKKALPLLRDKRTESAEVIRLLACLDRLEISSKISFADYLLGKLSSRTVVGVEHLLWALGRLGSRFPAGSSVDAVLPSSVVTQWWETISDWNWQRPELSRLSLLLSQIYRRTGNRTLDISEELRRDILKRMEQGGMSVAHRSVIREIVRVEAAERLGMLSEELPNGFRLLS
jgi:molecular chaperone DnaK (HSP70)